MGKRALLILNPNARQVGSEAVPMETRLRDLGFDVLDAVPAGAGDLDCFIRRHRDCADLIIIGGGDGTLNAAVEALLDVQLPIGILPLGTANDLARTLGLPLDPAAACEVIAQGHLRRVDLGWVNGKHFFNVAGLGLAVKITQRLTPETKSRWGVFAYLITALKVLVETRPFHAEIIADGESIPVRTVQITVGNGRHYGGGLTVDKQADIDDGLLHLYSLEIRRWWQLLWLLPAIWRGTLARWPMARTLKGKSFSIQVRKGVRSVTADGELISKTPATFRVVPQVLSVFVPKPEEPA